METGQVTTTPRKRWRPRFSMRTMVVFVTLCCVYIATWEITKKYGTQRLADYRMMCQYPTECSAPMPFVVCRDEFARVLPTPSAPPNTPGSVRSARHYYVWLPWNLVSLPYGGPFVSDEEVGARDLGLLP